MCQEREGIRVCVCVPSPEICDGLDNDCNPATPDGAAEVTLGDACDGTDADLCALGSVECNEGSLGCVDEAAPLPELCDGLDNDCNPDTVDGADEPSLGAECDGDDVDMCLTGTCVRDGGLDVSGGWRGPIEICDGLDNDCDGEVNEGGMQ